MRISSWLLVAAVIALPALLRGTIIYTTDPTLPPEIPGQGPKGVVYLTGPGVHTIYGTGSGEIDLTNVQHTNFTNRTQTPIGSNELENFNSSLFGFVTIGGGPLMSFELDGPVQVEAFGKTGNLTGTFNTQILSMNMTGIVGGHTVTIRQDPTTPSTGQTTIACSTPPCTSSTGVFQITSFFDVFTDISIDGGAFIPQSSPPTHVVAVTPEPGTLVLMGLSLILPVGRIRARIAGSLRRY